MTELSEPHHTRILAPKPVEPEVIRCERESQKALREKCRPRFERLRSGLIETYPNWFIAIDPNSEEYFLDPTLRGITQKISQATHTDNTVRMIFRLNDTGICGRLWV
ncbi:MAG: hypothetical protein RMY34_03825 [Aulosira sp. DedQUE10]|nr:hypothetical protein [Aulosira sp. DedQUE10]